MGEGRREGRGDCRRQKDCSSGKKERASQRTAKESKGRRSTFVSIVLSRLSGTCKGAQQQCEAKRMGKREGGRERGEREREKAE